MRSRGFQPSTVFDIGVADGTPWLYAAFPESYFVLVEANDEFEPALRQICKTYRCEYHIFCAGARHSAGILRINDDFKSSSGLLPHSEILSRRLASKSLVRSERYRSVEIRPLDDLLTEQMKAPFLLKLDIEGYEIEALKGAARILAFTDMIIAEVSVAERMDGEARFAGFIKHLDGIGFDLFDVLNMLQFQRGGRLAYLDAVFVRRDSFADMFC